MRDMVRTRLDAPWRRALCAVCALALVAAGVPLVASAPSAALAAQWSVTASELDGDVLMASVYADTDSSGAVDMYFTLVDADDDGVADACEVGRTNTSSGTSYAIDADYDGTVVIPAQVSYEGETYEVVAVQAYAFGSTSGASCAVTGVSVPYTVQEIGSSAFRACAGLVSLDFDDTDDNPSQLTTIGSFACLSCTALEAVVIPPSVVTIGSRAFRYCSSLASVVFDDIENSQLTEIGGSGSGENTNVGSYTFGCSEDDPGCLQSIVLPAGLESVPPSTFAYQVEMESCTFLGDTLNYIGSQAFYCCESLVDFVIPELAGYGVLWQYCLWDKAFYGCTSLTNLVFMGDGSGDGYKSYSEVFGETPSLEKVAYWNAEYAGAAQSQGGDSSASTTRLFGDDVEYYFNVTFYETEEDAQAGENELCSARINEDVTVEELRAALAGEAELDEDDVFHECGDEGTLPDAQDDVYWAFEGGYVDTSYLSACCYAWCDTVDEDGAIDMAACRISFPTSVFTTASAAVDMTGSYTIAAPDGGEIDSSAYTVYAVGTFTSGDGPDETTEVVTYDDISSLRDEGSYSLYFEAVEGEGYTGSTWVDFSILQAEVSLVGYPTSSKYAYTFVTEAYENGAYTRAVVVSSADAYGTAAGAWMASVMGAPLLVLPEGEVPDTNSSNYLIAALNYLFGDNQGTIYVIGDEDVVSADAYEAFGKVVNSAKTQRLSYTGAAAAARAWRSLGSSYDVGSTAYVVSTDEQAWLSVALQMAYEDGCPVFFCESDGTLDEYTRFVLKTGHFDEIVVVGEAGAPSDALAAQVGDDAAYTLTTCDVSEYFQDLATDYYEEHEGDSGLSTVFAATDADNVAYAAMAVVTAQLTGSSLLLFGSEEELEEAIPDVFLSEDVCVRTSSLLFVGDASYFDDAKAYLVGLWGGDDDEE